MMALDRTAAQINPFTGRDVPWLVDAQASALGDKPFLHWHPDGVAESTISYAEFAAETLAYAAGLAALDVTMGDFVVIHMDNCPEFLFAWFACSRLGAVAVTTNTRSTREELAYFIGHCGAVGAITQPKYAHLVQSAGPCLRWVASTARDADADPDERPPPGVIAFEGLRGDPQAGPRRAAEPMRANSVQYTSGTTSRPKGVVWTHANALWSGSVTASHAKLTADDVHIFYFPLFHTNALAYSVLGTLWSGGSGVMLPKFSASRFWPLAERYGCTWASMVPFTLNALSTKPDPTRHAFRFWAYSGDLGWVKERWGIKTIGWFGMTETVAQCIVSDLAWSGPERAMGVVVPEYEVQIRGEHGGPAAYGETGALWIRGIRSLSLFQGYLNDPVATTACFDGDGWFSTGDQAVVTETGHIFFAGREKDMLRVGGENVAALEIEAVILGVPGVQEVAVVGRPDRMLDEVPVAFVVSPSASDQLKASIDARCLDALSDFKRPRQILFVDELPKGVLDKVLKRELRERLRAMEPAS
jgi:crotonobetaine/carnitine-CoA ligase